MTTVAVWLSWLVSLSFAVTAIFGYTASTKFVTYVHVSDSFPFESTNLNLSVSSPLSSSASASRFNCITMSLISSISIHSS